MAFHKAVRTYGSIEGSRVRHTICETVTRGAIEAIGCKAVLLHSTNIQGVPGGRDNTSGECSLGQTIPI